MENFIEENYYFVERKCRRVMHSLWKLSLRKITVLLKENIGELCIYCDRQYTRLDRKQTPK